MPHRHTNMAIMVVTPDVEDVMAMQRELEATAVANRLVHAQSGADALRAMTLSHAHIGAGEIGLILSTEVLPDMHVDDLMGFVAERSGIRRIPFVVVTDHGEPSDWHLLQDLGAAAWIQRPVTGQAVLRAIRDSGTHWVHIAVLENLQRRGSAAQGRR